MSSEMFNPVDSKVDFPAQEQATLAWWEENGIVEKYLKRKRRVGQAILVHRRADHCQQPDGRAPRLGADLQGPVPAVQDDAGLPAALPERV